MEINVAKELAALQRMSVAQLREKYAEVFSEAATTDNRTWLLRRVGWRIQANAEGDLSERRARTRGWRTGQIDQLVVRGIHEFAGSAR